MPQFWKGDSGNSVRVRASDSHEADLVFIESRPFAVLEWAQTGAAMVTIELDPDKLRAADPSGRLYHYLAPLTDPR